MRSKELRGPPLIGRSFRYLRAHGLLAFLRRIWQEFRPAPKSVRGSTTSSDSSQEAVKASEFLSTRFLSSRPLYVYKSPVSVRRINMITDSINRGSLFGGVATAIILASLLAKRWDSELRVITRTEKARERNFGTILKLNNIPFTKNVDFLFADVNSADVQIDLSPNDYFLTTSWWTTRSVLQSVNVSRVIYLLQEDERMFYPHGDDHRLCSEILHSPGIRFVINTKLLFSHFVNEGFLNMRDSATWFEPSFSPQLLYSEKSAEREDKKRNLFFYARPSHPRNLFYLGLSVICSAIERKILDVNKWNIYFVGCDSQSITLDRGYAPIIVPNLGWEEYCSLVRKMDLGLCLMYTPHPSYPPLDLAACGGVVVTNTYGVKDALRQYSKNIICRDATIEGLLHGLVEGVALANDHERREKNYREDRLLRDWNESFSAVIKNLSEV